MAMAMLVAVASMRLLRAASEGDTDAADECLRSGDSVDSSEETSGKTPLHFAAESGHASMLAYLLAKGAKTDLRTKEDGQTALHLCTSADATRMLLEGGADPNLRDSRWKRTPLEAARSRQKDGDPRAQDIIAVLESGLTKRRTTSPTRRRAGRSLGRTSSMLSRTGPDPLASRVSAAT